MTTNDVVVDISQDWVLACDVQRRFMQGEGRTSDSVDYSARCRQVRALGGDCYDFMPLTNDRLALLVGDASGKGVAAAECRTSRPVDLQFHGQLLQRLPDG
jgi:serine phosphatase RsbU (regulator of sigma subunit)